MDRKPIFDDKIAVITGGSSGIGLETARLLSAKGAHVWLIARDQARLESAIATVRDAAPYPNQRFGIYSADVTDPHQTNRVLEDLKVNIGLPDVVITSAGATYPGYSQELHLDIYHRLMEVNYFGTVNVVGQVLSGMIARGSGQIVTISSLAGIIAPFGYTAYCASKFAVRGYSDALRSELKPYGVEVFIVFPPDTDTPQLAFEENLKPPETKALSSRGGKLSPATVAKAIVDGVARHKYLILPGWEAKVLYWLSGWTGPLQYKVIDLLVARAKNKE